MHHGFWDKKTASHYQAALQENQVIIDTAKIKAGDRVLDAGCGVGATAIYIAKKTGAKVTGISLVSEQVELAQKYAQKQGVDHLTSFLVQDYTRTNFRDKSFDAVYGIESICCASPKALFLQEARRLLKPDGRLVIADGYLARPPKNQAERIIIDQWRQDFSIKEMIPFAQMTQAIKLAGFRQVHARCRLEAILPGINHFYQLGKRWRWLMPLLGRAVRRNYSAFVQERAGCEAGLATYYLHSALK